MGGRVDVRGIDNVINNMQNLAPNVKRHLGQSAEGAGKVLMDAVLAKASLTCHSLEDLAAEGHPYSTAYPTDSFEHPDEFVHIQSGKLFAAIEKVVEVTDERVIVASGVSEEKVPYIGYLIDGTWKMRPRDFLGHAMQEKRDELIRMIKYGIVEGLGSRGGRRE